MNGMTNSRNFAWLPVLLLGVFVAGCSGDDNGRDPILGFDGDAVVPPPAVTAVMPADGATGVAIDDTVINATFSEPMNPLTGDASFTVTCEAPCEDPDGSVALNDDGTVATFTLDDGVSLETLTEYTGTITGATSSETGLAIEAPFVWSFTTLARPAVTAVVPANGATGVAININAITAEFSEPMNPLTGDASFTVTCEAPCADPAGSVALDADGTIATFAPDNDLDPLTEYTGTITGATSSATGVSIIGPFVWSFTTGVTPDVTRPRVTLTVPETTSPGPTTNVPSNTAISAAFTEDMAPDTIDDASFTVTCAAPCDSPAGTVTYSVGSRTAVFTPDAPLEDSTTYTATITDDATDLAGNQLAGNQAPLPAASDYVWTFTTSTPTPPEPISVFSTEPANGATICPDDSINATFDVPSGLRMDPNTVNAVTFSVTGPDGPVLANSVSLDNDTGTIATFDPLNDLTPGDTYTALIQGDADGVKDLAIPANEMDGDFFWTFEVAEPTDECLQPVSLNTAEPFGMLAGTAGMTNTGIQTIVNGDLATTTTATGNITGFHDENGDVYTESPANIGAVNGVIYSCTVSTTGPTSAAVNPANCDIATIARLDAMDAYNELAGLPGGPDPGAGNLANLTLAPGVYTAGGGSFMIQGGDLTLDAQGDSSAVWVFQMATSLTVGGPGAAFPQSIILTNNAQPGNVFWQVGSAATINEAGGGTMVGTIIASAGVSFSTVGNTDIVTLDGRAMSLNASVTLVDTIINVPNP